MYDVIFWAIILVAFAVVSRIVSTLTRGCFTFLIFLAIAGFIFVMVKSTKEPVYILDTYRIDKLEIRKL